MAAVDLHDSLKSPESSLGSPFHRLKFRQLAAIVILALAVSYAAAYVLHYLHVGYEIARQVSELAMWVVLLGLVLLSFKRAGTDFARLFGRIADFDLWLVCKATFFLYLFSGGSGFVITYLAYYPLETGFEGSTSSDFGVNAPFPLSIVPLVLAIILVPVTEEVVVRGALLHRFAVKWGIGTSLVLSSVIFAAYHRDVIGFVFLFAFGLVMSVIYIRTRSLLTPIACHATFLIVWSAQTMNYSASEVAAGEHLEFAWLYAALFLVSAVWIVRYLYKNWPKRTTPTPYYAEDTALVPPEVTVRQKNTLYAYVAVMLMGGMMLLWQSASNTTDPPGFPPPEDLPPGYHRIICPSGGVHDYPPDKWPFTEWPCTGSPCF